MIYFNGTKQVFQLITVKVYHVGLSHGPCTICEFTIGFLWDKYSWTIWYNVNDLISVPVEQEKVLKKKKNHIYKNVGRIIKQKNGVRTWKVVYFPLNLLLLK